MASFDPNVIQIKNFMTRTMREMFVDLQEVPGDSEDKFENIQEIFHECILNDKLNKENGSETLEKLIQRHQFEKIRPNLKILLDIYRDPDSKNISKINDMPDALKVFRKEMTKTFRAQLEAIQLVNDIAEKNLLSAKAKAAAQPAAAALKPASPEPAKNQAAQVAETDAEMARRLQAEFDAEVPAAAPVVLAAPEPAKSKAPVYDSSKFDAVKQKEQEEPIFKEVHMGNLRIVNGKKIYHQGQLVYDTRGVGKLRVVDDQVFHDGKLVWPKKGAEAPAPKPAPQPKGSGIFGGDVFQNFGGMMRMMGVNSSGDVFQNFGSGKIIMTGVSNIQLSNGTIIANGRISFAGRVVFDSHDPNALFDIENEKVAYQGRLVFDGQNPVVPAAATHEEIAAQLHRELHLEEEAAAVDERAQVEAARAQAEAERMRAQAQPQTQKAAHALPPQVSTTDIQSWTAAIIRDVQSSTIHWLAVHTNAPIDLKMTREDQVQQIVQRLQEMGEIHLLPSLLTNLGAANVSLNLKNAQTNIDVRKCRTYLLYKMFNEINSSTLKNLYSFADVTVDHTLSDPQQFSYLFNLPQDQVQPLFGNSFLGLAHVMNQVPAIYNSSRRSPSPARSSERQGVQSAPAYAPGGIPSSALRSESQVVK